MNLRQEYFLKNGKKVELCLCGREVNPFLSKSDFNYLIVSRGRPWHRSCLASYNFSRAGVKAAFWFALTNNLPLPSDISELDKCIREGCNRKRRIAPRTKAGTRYCMACQKRLERYGNFINYKPKEVLV